jgi:hypothetical protein
MISPGTLHPREDGRDRRREVKRRLAEAGFRGGPSRLRAAPDLAAPAADDEDERFAHRLAALLLRLGGLFPVFGFYLSSRADLLAAGECGELARLPAAAAPASPAAIDAFLAAELGRSPADFFAELDPAPCRSRLAVQAHRARLRTGEPAVVELVHPGLAGWLATDRELLPLLAGAFAARPGFPLLEAIADFEGELARETDLAATAAAMETLADDLGSLRGAAGGLAPRVFRALTRGRVLAYERLDGRTLAELLPASERADELRPLARRLCAAWLGQVLLGRTFPVAPRPEAVVAMAGDWLGDRIAFAGGPYEAPSAALQASLSRYLAAAARDDPDEVSASLLPELTRPAATVPGEPGGDEPLRLRLRQAVPLREADWTGAGDLAGQLLLHWRIARQEGYRPSAPLLAFYRGLFALDGAARRLDPAGDALRAGLVEVRLLASFEQLRAMLSLGDVGETLERYGALMLDLPQRLDGALTALAAGRGSSPADATPRAGEPRASWAFALAAGLALAAVAMATRQLAGLFAGAAGLWAERAGAGAFAVLGGLLLRAAADRRRSP